MSNDLNEASSLCFPKDSFSAPNFDLDTFLTRYKRDYGLERLQTDLAIYLKILKTSMIDLINKDYADFVNLSTNLVGLEKAINSFEKPLSSLKKDIESIQGVINNEHNCILNKINEKLSIERRKIVLKLLMNWERSLRVTNDMLKNDDKLTGDHIERIAFEFRQLQHSLSFCQKDNLTQNTEIIKLSQLLEKIMRDTFIKSFDSQDTDQLKHILKSYVLLSRQQVVEQLFKSEYVKKYMDNYIDDSFLDSNEFKLNGVYNKVLEFLDLNNKFLYLANEIKCSTLDVDLKTNSSEFNFIVNSVFDYAIEAVESNLSKIFSPANPDQFYKNYTISMKFLDNFETKAEKDYKLQAHSIRTSSMYKKFLQKWPTQIYFQIRFQEIATKLETHLQETIINESDLNFYLKSTNSLYDSMISCWKEGIYLSCLKSQFWKLNIELLSRFSNFFSLKLKTIQIDEDSLAYNVYLMVDLKRLCHKLPNFFDANIAPIMRQSGIKEISILNEAFLISINKFKDMSIQISQHLILNLVKKSFDILKNVSDTPRLYRRTNREIPKVALNYIRQSIQILIDFDTQWKEIIEQNDLTMIFHKVIDQLCEKYYLICSELLESIKKMEDSLKRLKKVRGDSTNDSLSTNKTTSDDDKIRLQLYIDVSEFGSNLNERFSYKGGNFYEMLFKLVDDIKKQIDY